MQIINIWKEKNMNSQPKNKEKKVTKQELCVFP